MSQSWQDLGQRHKTGNTDNRIIENADTSSFRYRVTITTGKYTGCRGTVESNVFQKSVNYLDEWANGFHVMLDSEELLTVPWDQVEALV